MQKRHEKYLQIFEVYFHPKGGFILQYLEIFPNICKYCVGCIYTSGGFILQLFLVYTFWFLQIYSRLCASIFIIFGGKVHFDVLHPIVALEFGLQKILAVTIAKNAKKYLDILRVLYLYFLAIF